MKFVICGYYGFANAGDEAILQALLIQLRAAQPAAQCTVLSGDPAATQAAHAVAAIHFTDLDAITAALGNCDWAVLGGGGLLHDTGGFDPASMLTPDHTGLAYYGGFAVLAQLLGKPLALWSVGVGPLRTPAARLFTQAIVELAAFASVRDAQSLEALRMLDVPVARVHMAADGAWLLPPVPAAAVGAVRPVLGVALREWSGAGAWEPAVVAALASVQRETGGTLQFVAMQQLAGGALDDDALAARLAGQMPFPERVLRTGWSGSPAQAAAALVWLRCRAGNALSRGVVCGAGRRAAAGTGIRSKGAAAAAGAGAAGAGAGAGGIAGAGVGGCAAHYAGAAAGTGCAAGCGSTPAGAARAAKCAGICRAAAR